MLTTNTKFSWILETLIANIDFPGDRAESIKTNDNSPWILSS